MTFKMSAQLLYLKHHNSLSLILIQYTRKSQTLSNIRALLLNSTKVFGASRDCIFQIDNNTIVRFDKCAQ